METGDARKHPRLLVRIRRGLSAVSHGVSTVSKGVDTVYKIVAILIFAGITSGAGVIASRANQSTPSPHPIATGVPNVYDIPAGQGVTLLQNAGYRPREITVCSGSVAGGKVRQVLTDVGLGDGIVLVDRDGVTPVGQTLSTGSAVVVKVSNGIPCS